MGGSRSFPTRHQRGLLAPKSSRRGPHSTTQPSSPQTMTATPRFTTQDTPSHTPPSRWRPTTSYSSQTSNPDATHSLLGKGVDQDARENGADERAKVGQRLGCGRRDRDGRDVDKRPVDNGARVVHNGTRIGRVVHGELEEGRGRREERETQDVAQLGKDKGPRGHLGQSVEVCSK